MKRSITTSPKPFPLALAMLAALAHGAAAQAVSLDQGAFRLSVHGREAGRDSFNIWQTGSGEDARLFLQGEVTLDQRRVSSILETTAELAFSGYQASISGDDVTDVTVRTGRRLEMILVSPAGERVRELRAQEGVVLLEESAAHLYYVVGALIARGFAREGSMLPVIMPRAGTDQARLQILSVVNERIAVGGAPVEARRLGLSLDGVERRVWIDARGRVLRVDVPSTGYLAERLSAPAP